MSEGGLQRMKTTATNRKIRELLTKLREGKLEPRPEFQRRLIWTNKDKCSFIVTVLLNYPFPEIYVAAGEVDVDTGEAKEMLVDGQQRVTTLFEYFIGSRDLKLGKTIRPYTELTKEEKEQFLQYDVVVRDLGKIEIAKIIEVFTRINATGYSLNAMEIHNARYEGEYKRYCEDLAHREFFETHRVFSTYDVRRMRDTRFALVLVTTILSTYFNRDDEIEAYLRQYNDEFPQEAETDRSITSVLGFIDELGLALESRAWQKADLFTLIVEVHRSLILEKQKLRTDQVRESLQKFFSAVEKTSESSSNDTNIARYYSAALQATNDRSSRVTRGEIIKGILLETVTQQQQSLALDAWMTAYKIDLRVEPPSYGKPFGHVVIGIPENQFLELKAKFPDEGFKGQNPKVDQTIKEGITNDEREQITKHLGLGPNTGFRFEFEGIVHHIDETKEQPQFESSGKKFWIFRYQS
jgi:hypothetical protein